MPPGSAWLGALGVVGDKKHPPPPADYWEAIVCVCVFVVCVCAYVRVGVWVGSIMAQDGLQTHTHQLVYCDTNSSRKEACTGIATAVANEASNATSRQLRHELQSP